MLLRSPSGSALVRRIAADPRPTYITIGRLPFERGANGIRITKGTTSPIPGRPGQMAGTTVVLDPINAVLAGAVYTHQPVYATGLRALAHELFHVDDMNRARTFQAAAAAGVEGDAPTRPGANDTEGGTAEQRALAVLAELGLTASSYTPDAAADSESSAILRTGVEQERQSLQLQLEKVMGMFSGHMREEAARQCKLGNPAACER